MGVENGLNLVARLRVSDVRTMRLEEGWRTRCAGFYGLLIWLVALSLPGICVAQVDLRQSPYDLEWGRGLAVGGAGVATFILGERASARMDLLRAEDIDQFELTDIFVFDRFAARQQSAFAKTVSDVTGYGSMVLPLSLLAGSRSRDHYDDVGLLYAQVFALNNGLTNLVKNTVRRSRPYVYNGKVPLSQKQIRDSRRSFFSGHTSNAAANAFFTAKAYSDFYPDGDARGWVWAGAITLPAVTGLTRVLAGKHYWSDVLVGYAIGAGIGLLVPELNLR